MQNRHTPFCEPSGVALRFSASPVMLTHIASRCQIPSCPPKLQRRRMGVPNISPLESNLKRVFLCSLSGKNCVYCHSPYPLYIIPRLSDSSCSLWREWVFSLVGAKGEEQLLDRFPKLCYGNMCVIPVDHGKTHGRCSMILV